MTWNEHAIARAISIQLLQRKCIVMVPNCTWTGHECDVLAVTTDLRIIDIEVKISRGDLKADAAKDKWWHRQTWAEQMAGAKRVSRPWPQKVWKHYYALPADVWSDDLLGFLPSTQSGILLLREGSGSVPVYVECRRRSTPNKDAARISAEQAVDIARLANLRMWDAYAQRDSAESRAKARQWTTA